MKRHLLINLFIAGMIDELQYVENAESAFRYVERKMHLMQ